MALTDQDPLNDEPLKNCRSCAARIIWVRTDENDKPMPLDAKPIIVFEATSSRRSGSVVVRTRKVRQSHFATCPDAAKHSRKSQESFFA
jgi:hypothetical protein